MPDIRSIAIYVLLATTLLLGVASCSERLLVRSTRADLVVQKAALKTQTEALIAQKKEAAERLRELNASVLAQQKRLDDVHAIQEKYDVANTKTIEQLRVDLARMRAAARRLLGAADAPVTGPGGGAEQGTDTASTGSGFGYRTQASGVLPDAPTDEGDEDAYDADRINNAYIACRADAVNVRKK
jgi:hypothetical protein